MSVRNLDKLFAPRSVALIGATPRPGSVGAVVARNLRRAGFAGELMLVNPHYDTIDGLTVHPNVASLPRAPDLGVIVTPAETVPCLIHELAARHARGCNHYCRFRRTRSAGSDAAAGHTRRGKASSPAHCRAYLLRHLAAAPWA